VTPVVSAHVVIAVVQLGAEFGELPLNASWQMRIEQLCERRLQLNIRHTIDVDVHAFK
jgi:hypothetical protein